MGPRSQTTHATAPSSGFADSEDGSFFFDRKRAGEIKNKKPRLGRAENPLGSLHG